MLVGRLAFTCLAFAIRMWVSPNSGSVSAAGIDDIDEKVENQRVEPQVIFKEEGELAASLSFGHLAIDLNLEDAIAAAKKIEGLLDSATELFRKHPFQGQEKTVTPGKDFSFAIWNRTRSRFDRVHKRFTETMKMLYHDLEESAPLTTPEELARHPPGHAVRLIQADVQRYNKRTPIITTRAPAVPFKPPTHRNGKLSDFSDFGLARSGKVVNALPSQITKEPETLLDRSKRFAVTAGTILIGGIITTIIGAVSVTNAMKIAGFEKGSVSAQQADFIVETLQSHEDILAQLRQDALETQSEIHTLQVTGYQNTNSILNIMHNVRAAESANTLIDEYEQYVLAIERGLGQLIHGKLDSALIAPSVIIDLVTRMKAKAEKASLVVPVTDVASVYTLGCSFVARKPYKLTVIVHLPLTRSNNLMTLYRFLDLGYALNSTNLTISIDVEKPLIAVNSERTGFLLLDSLDDCIQMSNLNMCPGHNFQLKSFEDYCIASLFLNRVHAVENLCTTNVLPSQARVIQHSRTSFYVLHPIKDTLIIDQCTNTSHNRQLKFRGTRLIELQEGCFGHTGAYQLSPLAELGLRMDQVTFTSALSLPKLLKGVTVKTLAQMFPHPPAKVFPVPDISREFNDLGHDALFGFSWWPHIPGISAGFSALLIIIILVTLFFCCRPQINGYLSKPAQGPVIHVSQQGQRGQQEQPLMQEMTEFNNPRMERHPSRESVASYFRPQAAFNRLRGSVSQMNLNKLGRRHRQNRSKTQVDNSFETSDPESGIASSQATSQAPTEN